jgi:hypothetical protein
MALPAKSTFVFQNLERWWIKAKDGELLLNELAKLIEVYGDTHYFIMNANIHSYQLMTEVSFIQSVIARSVILAPLTPVQTRNAIWNRHKTSGLIAHFSGDSEKHLTPSKLLKALNKFHQSSNGVVGVALNQWMASIHQKNDHDIQLNAPKKVEFPALVKTELKNLIYQLFIHYNLTRTELTRLYGKENAKWIERNLNSLEAAGLIRINERDAYSISALAKPYVENWLSELGFIK